MRVTPPTGSLYAAHAAQSTSKVSAGSRQELVPQLHIDIQQPALEVSLDFPRVHIDATGSYEELGLKRSSTLARDLARRAIDLALAEIAQTARLGDRLAAFERGGNIAAEAAAKAWPGDHQQINVGVAPSRWVPIDVELGQVSLSLRPGSVEVALSALPGLFMGN